MRRAASAIGVVGVLLATATACYPPSQTPTPQPLPPGGRAVATSAALTDMLIADATADLSTIVYSVSQIDFSVPEFPIRFYVYDEGADRSTALPTGNARRTTVAVAPDGRSVAFTSIDRTIQVGPTTTNCWEGQGPLGPPYAAATCGELYLYDLDTGQTRQLTGLGGSSDVGYSSPRFTDDGTAIVASVGNGRDASTSGYRRIDLATGQIEAVPTPAPAPTSWDRGSHVVRWDGNTGTLTSEDATTGEVTTLWADPDVYYLDSVTGDGRFVVVTRWLTDQTFASRLIDTDTGRIRVVQTRWISDDGSRYAVVQWNVSPDAIDRLVLAPLPA